LTPSQCFLFQNRKSDGGNIRLNLKSLACDALKDHDESSTRSDSLCPRHNAAKNWRSRRFLRWVIRRWGWHVAANQPKERFVHIFRTHTENLEATRPATPPKHQRHQSRCPPVIVIQRDIRQVAICRDVRHRAAIRKPHRKMRTERCSIHGRAQGTTGSEVWLVPGISGLSLQKSMSSGSTDVTPGNDESNLRTSL
jgi:hypothetical protein